MVWTVSTALKTLTRTQTWRCLLSNVTPRSRISFLTIIIQYLKVGVYSRSEIPEVLHQWEIPVNTDGSTHNCSIILLCCDGLCYSVWVCCWGCWKVMSDFLLRNTTHQIKPNKRRHTWKKQTDDCVRVFIWWFLDQKTFSITDTGQFYKYRSQTASVSLYVFLTPSTLRSNTLSCCPHLHMVRTFLKHTQLLD